jgi:hypothetical protein
MTRPVRISALLFVALTLSGGAVLAQQNPGTPAGGQDLAPAGGMSVQEGTTTNPTACPDGTMPSISSQAQSSSVDVSSSMDSSTSLDISSLMELSNPSLSSEMSSVEVSSSEMSSSEASSAEMSSFEISSSSAQMSSSEEAPMGDIVCPDSGETTAQGQPSESGAKVDASSENSAN